MVKKRYVTLGLVIVVATISVLSSYHSETGSSSETRFVVSIDSSSAVDSSPSSPIAIDRAHAAASPAVTAEDLSPSDGHTLASEYAHEPAALHAELPTDDGAPTAAAKFEWGDHGPTYSLEQRVAHVESMVMHDPGATGPNVLMALMTNMGTDIMKFFVGSLRKTGYDGRIILGVESDLNEDGRQYLVSQNVTLIGIKSVPCIVVLQAIKNQSDQQNSELSSCGQGYEDLYFEESRFAMALDWLEWCGGRCEGWAIVSDSSDTYFQADPFKEMHAVAGPPEEADQAKNFFVIGEWRLIVDHWFIKSPVERCYDLAAIGWERWKHRPMVCSGTSVGTLQGMADYLRVITREFRRNVAAGWACLQPPYTDQAVHDMLFYTGQLGPKASMFEWGQGPIFTLGEPCEHGDPNIHSRLDVVHPDEANNVNRPDGTLAPMLHQWDRCWDWIMPILHERFDN